MRGPQPYLFIDAQHGLCNRLRAIASAAVIARATDRRLVVIWRPDAHCMARLPDLLDYDGPVLDHGDPDAFRARATLSYNYMEIEEGAEHGAQILGHDPGGDVYIRAGDTLVSELTSMAQEQVVLRGFVPAQAVWDLVQSVPHTSDVAAHIRMATGPAYDHLAHESSANWPAHRHEALVAWRNNSDVSRFVARLDRAFDAGARHAFIAADLPETYDTLRARFGDRVRYLARDCFDRSARQVQFALADLMLLTTAPLLLASPGSSFSDVAQRLSRAFHRVERSGTDF